MFEYEEITLSAKELAALLTQGEVKISNGIGYYKITLEE